MKRFFTVLAILAVLVSAGLCTLSCIPHTHAGDFDHSQHKSCPVYQFSLHALDAAVPLVQALVLLAALRFLAASAFVPLSLPALAAARSRAPPSA